MSAKVQTVHQQVDVARPRLSFISQCPYMCVARRSARVHAPRRARVKGSRSATHTPTHAYAPPA
eukprot:3526943-Pleurochrysis_carterae.AAC.1